MGKRKLKTNPTTSDNEEKNIPNEERKEKLVPNFDESKCDVIIITVDKEIHLPSSFLEMMSNDEDIQMTDGKIKIDVYSETLIKALSFYRPKNCKDTMTCKFLKNFFLHSFSLFKWHFIPDSAGFRLLILQKHTQLHKKRRRFIYHSTF